MKLPQVPEYRLDINGQAKENLITRETLVRSENGRGDVIVPKHAPFFMESLVLYFPESSTPLILNKDYEFVDIDHELSEFCGAPISWFIKLKSSELQKVQATYQTLGSVPKLTETTKQWFISAINDERPVWWDYITNKPTLFDPRVHGHDLNTAFYNFQALAKIFKDKREILFGENGPIPHRDFYLQQITNLESYIQPMHRYLVAKMTQHHENKRNTHGVTSRQIPGMELIDNVRTATLEQTLEHESSQLRVVSKGAYELIKSEGLNKSDYIVHQDLAPQLLYKTDKIDHYGNVVDVGIKEVVIVPIIDKDLQGFGLGQFYRNKGSVVNWVVNRNPLGFTDNVEPNQWVNTQNAFYFIYEGDSIFPSKIIPGSNKDHVLMVDEFTGMWYVVNLNGVSDPNLYIVTKITNANDLTPHLSDIKLCPTEHGLLIYRHDVSPSRESHHLEVYLIEYSELNGNTVTLKTQSFNSRALIQNQSNTVNNRIPLAVKKIQNELMTENYYKFSNPVKPINDNRSLVILNTSSDAVGNTSIEIIVPETFFYKGGYYRLTHRIPARMFKSGSTWRLDGWFSQNGLMTLDTDDLVSGDPQSTPVKNFLLKTQCNLPYEATTKGSSICWNDLNSLFLFGYKHQGNGDTFSARLDEGNIKEKNQYGRKWNLDNISDWTLLDNGQTVMTNNVRIDTGHPSLIHPYFGVLTETEINNRMVIVKGYHREHGLGFFAKTGIGGDVAIEHNPEYAWSRASNNQIEWIEGLNAGQYLGYYLNPKGEELEQKKAFFSVIDNTTPQVKIGWERYLLPMDDILLSDTYVTTKYMDLSKAWLNQFNLDGVDYWTVMVGQHLGLPNFVVADYRIEGELRSKVTMFKFIKDELTRVDEVRNGTQFVLLTETDSVSILSTKTVTHDVPDMFTGLPINDPKPSLITGGVTVVKQEDGKYWVELIPNNQYGDHLFNYSLTTTLKFDSQLTTITEFISNGYGYDNLVISASPLRGWTTTNIDTQYEFAGLINAGNVLLGNYLQSITPSDQGDVKYGGWDIVVNTQWMIFNTTEFYYLLGNQCYPVPRLSFRAIDFKPFFGENVVYGFVGNTQGRVYIRVGRSPIPSTSNEVRAFSAVLDANRVVYVNQEN